MIVDLKKYEISKQFIQEWYLSKKDEDVSKLIGVISLATFVPIIVCAFYIGEVCEWDQKVLDKIGVLIEFYDYKDIINKPDSFPKK